MNARAAPQAQGYTTSISHDCCRQKVYSYCLLSPSGLSCRAAEAAGARDDEAFHCNSLLTRLAHADCVDVEGDLQMADEAFPTGKDLEKRLRKGKLPQMVDWFDPLVLGMVA